MKVEIIVENDESFTLNPAPVHIECKQFGNVWVACDGEMTTIGSTEQEAIEELEIILKSLSIQEPEQVVEEIPQPPVQRGARIDNHVETNSFDWFSGTSWAGKKQNFD